MRIGSYGVEGLCTYLPVQVAPFVPAIQFKFYKCLRFVCWQAEIQFVVSVLPVLAV